MKDNVYGYIGSEHVGGEIEIWCGQAQRSVSIRLGNCGLANCGLANHRSGSNIHLSCCLFNQFIFAQRIVLSYPIPRRHNFPPLSISRLIELPNSVMYLLESVEIDYAVDKHLLVPCFCGIQDQISCDSIHNTILTHVHHLMQSMVVTSSSSIV